VYLHIIVIHRDNRTLYKSRCHTGVQKNPFLKMRNPLNFWILVGFSDFFYLNELFGSLLVDLAHQLSFYLDSPVL